MFEDALEQTRTRYGLFVYGYVVTPGHVHLLLSETTKDTPAHALKALKLRDPPPSRASLPAGMPAAPPHPSATGGAITPIHPLHWK